MPDGQAPFESDAARRALDAARRHLEAELAGYPDWIALGAILGGEITATAADRQAVEARLEALPAYRALRDLDLAAGLLPPTDLLPLIQRRHERDMLVPVPVAIEDATIDRGDAATVETTAGPARDDLTRIRGIDATLARRLAAIGIRRFDQIAGWSADDVRTIAQGLGLGRAFVRHGVVEQAAALAQVMRSTTPRSTRAAGPTPPPAELASTPPPAELAPTPGRQSPPASAASGGGTSGVMTWTPTTLPGRPVVRGLTEPPPTLRPAVRQSILARIRRGPRGAGIVSLAAMAPELAQSIFIAQDVDQPDLKSRWSPTPFEVLPPVTVTEPLRQLFATARLAAPVPVMVHEPDPAEPAAVAAAPPPVPDPPPLHDRAARRLDALEAELNALTRQPPVKPAPASVRPATAAARPQTPEATVEINRRPPRRSPASAPMAALTLQPAAKSPTPDTASPREASLATAEADVVIVRHGAARSPTRAALRVPPAGPVSGSEPARRGLKSLFGWSRGEPMDAPRSATS